MPKNVTRQSMRQRLIEAAENDSRIVGLLDYGSSSEDRADMWSDLDVALFIRDAAFAGFERGWQAWAAGLGPLLLAYVGHVGHPWTVYAAEPVPLRVDFDLHPESAISTIEAWPNSPTSADAMLWHDDTGGTLRAAVSGIVGQSLAPVDSASQFTQLAGDLWYFLLYCHCKLQRGELWVARQVFHCEVLEHLLRLVRMEAGAFERWRGSQAAKDIEVRASPARLRQLDASIPDPNDGDLRVALAAAHALGAEVCRSLATQSHWPWPNELADELGGLFEHDGR